MEQRVEQESKSQDTLPEGKERGTAAIGEHEAEGRHFKGHKVPSIFESRGGAGQREGLMDTGL